MPEAILLAIVAVGARFSSLSRAASFANSIAELNRRIFLLMPKMAKEIDIQRIQEWLCEGASVRLGVYRVPDLGSQESRVQVIQETLSILQNMRTWRLSKAFSEVIRQLILVESKGQA
ncbi:hypothetical protein EDB80DRAFT_863000 [Ilyonectria destructans]|nr:hypothetical protein EDB80DRAFT_863000 [Ilyonectria destructans]